jgi:hypothetical protein
VSIKIVIILSPADSKYQSSKKLLRRRLRSFKEFWTQVGDKWNLRLASNLRIRTLI